MTITRAQKKELARIGKKHNIKLAMIFGSRAKKGNPREDSDLDIAFIFKNRELKISSAKKYSYYYGELFKDLSNVFKGYNVDLADLKNTDFIFRYELFLNSILIIGTTFNFCEFQSRAYREYMDSYDLLKLYDILSLKKEKLIKQKIYA